MFIAAFVAGLCVQKGFPNAAAHSLAFGEIWGQLLNLSVFFLFGLVVVAHWRSFDLATLAYAVASLTVVRLVPVAAGLAGTGLNRATVAFIGWFGPRGLASIVLGLVYLDREISLPGEAIIRNAVIVTVLLSILLHGLSARPGIALYGRVVTRLAPDTPERRNDGVSGPEARADGRAVR